MKYLIDTHVHTVASGHAYSTIDEIAKVAEIKGMEMVAITDHSPGLPGGAHEFYFTNMKILPDYLHGVRILKGVECNIIDYEGSIDFGPNVLGQLDLVIASLHPPCIPYADKEVITRTVIKTMENPYVNIIGHPGDDRYPLDMDQIAYYAKEHKVLLEVNNSSLKRTSTRVGGAENVREMLLCCKNHKTPVIIGSDAHFSHHIGGFDEAIELLKEIDFPEHLVMNRNKEEFMNYIRKGR